MKNVPKPFAESLKKLKAAGVLDTPAFKQSVVKAVSAVVGKKPTPAGK